MNDTGNTTEYNESDIYEEIAESNECVQESVVRSEDDTDNRKVVKVYNRSKAIRIIVIETLVFILLISATIAWFTMSDGNSAGGINMSSSDILYEISSPTTGNPSYGIYYDDYHTVIRAEEQSEALVWQMTSDSNIENYDGSTQDGIEPGKSGELSFVVTPKVDNLSLKFNLELIGYTCEVEEGENEGDPDTIHMTKVTDESLNHYLTGHILFFRGYDPATDMYSDPITSDEDMNRMFEETFSTANVSTPVSIYWVWPGQLYNVVNAYDGTTITNHPFMDTTTEDYQDLIDNICDYPQYFFKGNVTQSLTENVIKNSYSSYGALYDGADNDIGTSVNYVLVRLSVSDEE